MSTADILNQLLEQEKQKLDGGVQQVPKEEQEEPDNEIGVVESTLAGVASGLIKIPEGVVSLGAELIDLGADTNNAAKVEKFFDEVNIFDEAAEATAAGKIAEVLVNIGVPGGFAFSKGASLASKAIKAKKQRRYLEANNNNLKEATAAAQKLNKKEKAFKYAAGSLGAGAAEGVFVADVEDVGTISDLFGDTPLNPLALERDGEYDPGRELVNRVKFGTEGALFSGLIGGTGATLKKMATRTDSLLKSNSQIDRLLGRIGAGFRPQGKKSKEFFETERLRVGEKSADTFRAEQISKDTDKIIDKIFPSWKAAVLNKTVGKDKTKAYKIINDALLSENVIVNEAGKVTFGKVNATALRDYLKKKATTKQVDDIVKGLDQIRDKWGEMFSQLGTKLNEKDLKQFRELFKDKFRGYLDTSYEIFKKDSLIPLQNYKPSEQAVEEAVNLFQRIARSKGKSMTREQALSEVNSIVKTAKLPRGFIFTDAGKNPDPIFKLPDFFLGKTTADELSQELSTGGMTSIKSIKDPERRRVITNLLGKQDNAILTILTGTERLSNLLRGSQFYDNLLEASNKAKAAGKPGLFFDSGEEASKVFGADNVRQIKFLDPARKYEIGNGNPLNELHTDDITYEALTTVDKINDKGIGKAIYDNFVLYPKATSQIAKTILSPITHVRNFISAGAFAGANGILPGITISPTQLLKDFKDTYGTLSKSNGGEVYEKLLKLGVVNSNVRLGDLRKLLDDVNFGETLSQTKGLKSMMRALSKVKKFGEDLYTAEDDFWKITTFAVESRRLRNAYKRSGISRPKKGFKSFDDQIAEEAAEIVRNNVPNYDYVSEFVKATRKMPIGNFVSFPAEIIRTGTNIVRRSLKEINFKTRNDNGDLVAPLRRIGLQRLFGFGTTVIGLPYGIQEAYKTIYNVAEDEMEALKRYVPDWSKNSVLIPIRGKDGKLKYVDFSHSNAYDTLSRPIQTVINAVAEGRDDENGIMDDFTLGVIEATKELGSPFISESIWTEALLDVTVRGGRTRSGRTLYTDETPDGEKAVKRLEHLITTQLPGSLAQLERLDIAFKPIDIPIIGKTGPEADFDEYGKGYEIPNELAGIFGYRAIEVDPENSINFKIADFQSSVRNARRLFTSPLLKGGVVQPSEIVDRYIATNDALFDAYKEIRKDYVAALKLGADSKELTNSFSVRGLKSDLGAIMKGDFRPFTLSRGIIQAFKENAEQIGVQNPYPLTRNYLRELFRLYNSVPLLSPNLPNVKNIFRDAEKLFPATTAPKYLDSPVPGVTPDILPMSGNLRNVNPQTGNTNVETALLDPDDQAIARNLRR
jgi:hypothetical protein